MALGVPAPSALSLEEIGVSQLLEANLPLPTDPAWILGGLSFAGGRDSLADPRPDAYKKSGLPGRTHDLVFHDCIHVFPRRRDLGAVVSEQEIEVEVWNAFLTRARILADITVEGPAGIEVIDHLGLPAHFPASDSQVYAVKVSAEGDPQIDNVVTWVFIGIDESGTGIRILGFRLIPFPFAPNMAQPISETFGYVTDILTAYTGMEQRVQLRAVPIGTVSYSTFLNEARDAQMANAIVFGNQPRAFGVGRWQFRTALTADATMDELEVYCETDDIPFEVGGLVMLWVDPYRWEVQTIDSVEPDHLVLTTGLRGSWTAGLTSVMPMVVGRLSPDEALTWQSLAAVSQSLTFDIDGFRP